MLIYICVLFWNRAQSPGAVVAQHIIAKGGMWCGSRSAAEGRKLQSPKVPCPLKDHVHLDTPAEFPAVNIWQAADTKGQNWGSREPKNERMQKMLAFSCLLLGYCYDSMQAKMALSSHWVHNKMDALLCGILCPLLQVLLPYLTKSFNKMRSWHYFLRVQTFLTRRSVTTSSIAKRVFLSFFRKTLSLITCHWEYNKNRKDDLEMIWKSKTYNLQTAHNIFLRHKKFLRLLPARGCHKHPCRYLFWPPGPLSEVHSFGLIK